MWGAFIPPVPAEDTWEGWAPKLSGANSNNTEGAEYKKSRECYDKCAAFQRVKRKSKKKG